MTNRLANKGCKVLPTNGLNSSQTAGQNLSMRTNAVFCVNMTKLKYVLGKKQERPKY
jgi:hypothetical protein